MLEKRMKAVPEEIRASVDMSFAIVDRICDILEAKGWKQKDLAERMGKTEAEISRWMRGTHNFTLDTIAAIQTALGERIIDVITHIHRPASGVIPIRPRCPSSVFTLHPSLRHIAALLQPCSSIVRMSGSLPVSL